MELAVRDTADIFLSNAPMKGNFISRTIVKMEHVRTLCHTTLQLMKDMHSKLFDLDEGKLLIFTFLSWMDSRCQNEIIFKSLLVVFAAMLQLFDSLKNL